MSMGKYSPTVEWAYRKNQEWFRKNSIDGAYDSEGYDSYGYHRESGLDRAGYIEYEYMRTGYWDDGELRNFGEELYQDVANDWTFSKDNGMPVRRI